MANQNPLSTAKVANHPIHPMLVPFPIAFLVGAFVCDLIFWQTTTPGWATASMWLLGAGLVTGALAAVFGLIDFLGEPRIRAIGDAWQHFIANAIAIVVALINFYIRYRNGAPAGVFPAGIWLSLLTVLILLFSGWRGGDLVYRWRVGISNSDT